MFLSPGAFLGGFTLSNGFTLASAPDKYGGGAFCYSPSTVSNCIVVGCSARENGGGIKGGTVLNSTVIGCSVPSDGVGQGGGGVCDSQVYNSLVANNTAPRGGGSLRGELTDCVISNNTAIGAAEGGGVYGSTLSRCLVVGNKGGYGAGAAGATVHHSVLKDNSAFGGTGGGVYQSSLHYCALVRNSAETGGGATESELYNCTVVGNSAWQNGGGLFKGTALNTLVAFNSGDVFADVHRAALVRCRTSRLRSGDTGIETYPLLADWVHISADSPCRGAGLAGTAGPDLDGDPWASPPSIGCDEYNPASATGALRVAIIADYTHVAAGFEVTLTADIEGHALGHEWDFGDGSGATNRLVLSHAWSEPGVHAVVLRAWNGSLPDGTAATTTVSVAARPVFYVNRANAKPLAPYTNWADAATTIQAAIDQCALPGSIVCVTNGEYDCGSGGVIAGGDTRVIVTNGTTVRSVNGPTHTSIQGSPSNIRCAYVGPKSRLEGFTLTNGHAAVEGGGAFCASGGVLSNCAVRDCGSAWDGGGVSGGTIQNCRLFGNTAGGYGAGASRVMIVNSVVWSNTGAWQGSGLNGSDADNVTVTANSADSQRGGAYDCTFRNAIVWGNTAPNGPYDASFSDCDFVRSCVSKWTTDPPAGNITEDPLLNETAWGDFRLGFGSPCIDSGTNGAWMAGAEDMGGAPRIINGRVDMGAFEYYGAPFLAITNAPPGSLWGENCAYTFRGINNPYVIGSVVWTNAVAPAGGAQQAATPWSVPDVPLLFGSNVFTITGWNPGGQAATATAVVVRLTEHGGASPFHYASASGGNAWPYDSWKNAASVIQDALNAAVDGDAVIVTNGLYNAGGLAVHGGLTSRVALVKAVTLRSVNGPASALIVGAAGDGAARCAYVGTNAVLCGFTLTNGNTRNFGDTTFEQRGGGAWCEPSGTVSNCLITRNSAFRRGGGVSGGTLWNCMLSGNHSDGGGGVYQAVLRNCTVADNTAESEGGGASGGVVYNSIVYHNTPDNLYGGSASYTCSSPLPGGAGNIATAPDFVDRAAGNYRLAAGSAGIDAGSATQAPERDIDGVPRPLDGDADGNNVVDMGAYEAVCDAADSDQDGMRDGHEMRARTDPLDPQSLLQMLWPEISGSKTGLVAVLRWQSVDGVRYSLERSMNLLSDHFEHNVRSNIVGVAPVNTVTDAPPAAAAAYFYRVRLD